MIVSLSGSELAPRRIGRITRPGPLLAGLHLSVVAAAGEQLARAPAKTSAAVTAETDGRGPA